MAKLRVDTEGRVVERVDFAWDDATLVEETTTGPAGAGGVRTRTWDHDEHGLRPLVERSSGEWDQQEVDRRFFAIVTDLVGAPTELLDRDGRVAGQVRRSVWGDSTWTGVGTPLEFPGQYTDDESGLRYNVFRYYDTDTGSYLSSDPLGLVPTPHARAYVINPLALTDPLGLAPCLPGRSGAFNNAKRAAGIPVSQHPTRVDMIDLRDSNGAKVIGADGLPVQTRNYIYDSGGRSIVVQEHSLGHQWPGGVGDQGPHFNVREDLGSRVTRDLPGVDNHFYFNP